MFFCFKLLLLCFAVPISLHALFRRAGFHHPALFAVAFCLNTAVIAWSFALLLRLLPGQHPWFYFGVISLAALPACFLRGHAFSWLKGWRILADTPPNRLIVFFNLGLVARTNDVAKESEFYFSNLRINI